MKYKLTTINELNIAGVPRMRALPGQEIDGKPIQTNINIACKAQPRLDNPIGTIFETDILIEKKTISGDLYYEVTGELIVVK